MATKTVKTMSEVLKENATLRRQVSELTTEITVVRKMHDAWREQQYSSAAKQDAKAQEQLACRDYAIMVLQQTIALANGRPVSEAPKPAFEYMTYRPFSPLPSRTER